MNKPFKIGVFGSGVSDTEIVTQKAKNLAQALSKYPTILITGGASGLPYTVAKEVRSRGVKVWGYSPAENKKQHQKLYPEDDISVYDKLFYIPPSFDFITIHK